MSRSIFVSFSFVFLLVVSAFPEYCPALQGPPPPPPPPFTQKKEWRPAADPAQAGDISGGEALSYSDLSVEYGGTISLDLGPAIDKDYWVSSSSSGENFDDVTFTWMASSGALVFGLEENKVTWAAPRIPGDYLVECIIDDAPRTISSRDSGSRDDAPIKRIFQIRVSGPTQAWSATQGDPSGSNIVSSGISMGEEGPTSDNVITYGASVNLLLEEVEDIDYWSQESANGEDRDKLTFAWTCSAGHFIKANGETSTVVSTGEVPEVQWIAPDEATASTATITCTVDDGPLPILSPDHGSRDDAPLTRSLTLSLSTVLAE